LSSLELRNSLLMQWSTFRCAGAWRGQRQPFKLLIGSLAPESSMDKDLSRDASYWFAVRRRYLWMKM
jgi:hypothetical protein